jgi:hypothetical protein
MKRFFRARAADKTVAVEMSGDVADFLRRTAADLIHVLEWGRTIRTARYRSLRTGRMFPPAYSNRHDTRRFRSRHRTAQREHLLESARRVLAGWDGSRTVTLDHQAVRDWFTVYGHARTLYSRRPWWKSTSLATDAATLRKSLIARNLIWLTIVRDHLAQAIVTPPGCSSCVNDRDQS